MLKPWRSPILAALLATGMLALLIHLGFWQLDRAAQKEALLARFEANSARAAVSLDQALAADGLEGSAYRTVTAEGRFDVDRQFLLDNRTRNGRAGYHVLTPLVTDRTAILINRGWIAIGPSRAELPDVGGLPGGRVSVRGALTTPSRPGLVLGDTGHDRDASSGWPRVVQTVELAPMASALGYALAPAILLLDASQPACLDCTWAPAAGLRPQIHRGYALQWFSLAAALVVLCALLLRRRTRRRG